MSNRTIDFFSSFGMMLVGVGLVFWGTVRAAGIPERPPGAAAAAPRLALASPLVAEDKIIALPVSRPRPPQPAAAPEAAPLFTAAAAVVVDDATEAVLYQQDSGVVRPLASLTKLMAALVLDELPWSDSSTTVVMADDLDPNSHHLQRGERLTVKELWQVALAGSSNSAINALVRVSGLPEEQLVARMNEQARARGLLSLQFVEPTGLESGNIGSAQEAAQLLKLALSRPRIKQALAKPQVALSPVGGAPREAWNTNWLLTGWVPHHFGAGAVIGKTGYITDSGYNFAARIAPPGEHAVRVVVLGAPTNEERFTAARDLAAWALENFVWPDAPARPAMKP
ncbi:MAG: D-alanyl-D-alanine carboxypeptidase [Candidatus Magasanikbacteria bacterium]|nr:D-alanyl-D-alanine carboxypeptidase [Candidatus Magasanikbacteria bacterium]